MTSQTSETAFATLLRELEGSMDSIKQDGAKAFQAGDYDKAKELTEKGKLLNILALKLSELRQQWNLLLEETPSQLELLPPAESKPKKAKIAKIKKGLRTHEDAYREPILQALVEQGGASNLNTVIDRVGELMKPILNKYDYLTLKSDPGTPRWRNAAQWVRYQLVKEGLMASDSPAGTWEITPKGRQWLKEHKGTP